MVYLPLIHVFVSYGTVNIGKYTIHGSYGIVSSKKETRSDEPSLHFLANMYCTTISSQSEQVQSLFILYEKY